MHEEQENLERRADQWLAGSLSWDARLQTLRARADLALADHTRATDGVPTTEPGRDHLISVGLRSRPDIAGWNEHLDRTA